METQKEIEEEKRERRCYGVLENCREARRTSRSKEAMEGDTLSAAAAAAEDGKVLHAFQTSFVQVQSLLDQNRVLINEINQNHESKVPGDLSRNVGLIRELNNNIRRVVDLYADLSSLFAASSAGGAPAASEGASVGTAVRHAGHKRVRSTHLD
uniref:Protein EARLY FLOWERING 4 domain-containing protein n=1 Tax=Oryza meridionalis TaxID=40149 RepID=A0A0E0D225_9ORYZ